MHRLVAVLLLAPVAVAAGPDVGRELQAAVDAFLAENPSAPGVAVHVVCPAHGLDRGFAAGTVARDDPTPLTAAHTFRIASNTKTYVAAAVLRLVEQGRLDLDDTLGRRLCPERRALLSGDGYELDAITLAHLLSHTAGLDEHAADPRYAQAVLADPQRRWTADEQVRLLVEWRDPVGPAGAGYHYSDTGYVLLGGIVADVAGEPLGPAVRRLLEYARLGLRATWWEVEESPPAGAGPRAHQYYGEHDVTGWDPSLDLHGGGGLVSDARDLARFVRSLLKGEVLRDEATLAAMTGTGTASYRLGLMSMELAGYQAFGHQGFWNTFAFHVPALDLTVAGSVNDHGAANGKEFAATLIAAVAAADR